MTVKKTAAKKTTAKKTTRKKTTAKKEAPAEVEPEVEETETDAVDAILEETAGYEDADESEIEDGEALEEGAEDFDPDALEEDASSATETSASSGSGGGDDSVSDSDLEGFGDLFDQTEAAEDEMGDVPPGTYAAVIAKAHLKKSKAGNVLFAWEFKVTGPTHANRRVWMNSLLRDSEGKPKTKSIGYFKRDVTRCGVPLASVNLGSSEGFEKLGEMLVGRQVQVSVKKNGEYLNVYLDKLLKAGEDAAEGSDDEIGDIDL